MMNTKALRQKILDLAIHGKLVPQDPNDEPASVLLERIKAEKERLIKEGKIKRTKRSKAACDKPHYPFELPEGWEWCKLEDIVSFGGGKTPSMSVRQYWENGTNLWVTSKDMKKERINDSLMKITDAALEGMNIYEKGTILVVTRSGILKHTLPLAILVKKATVNQDLKTISPYMLSLSEYLYFAIKANEKEILANYHKDGTTVDSIDFDKFRCLPIALPPMYEQERIVKCIKYWFSLIESIEENRDKLQEVIKQTKSKILDLAIHGKLVPQDPSDEPASELLERINPKAEITCDNPQYRKLPKGWAVIRVGNVAKYTNGRAFKPEEWESTGLPIIRIQNLNDADAPYNRSSVIHEQKYLIKDGDLLFAWAASIGTYIWSGENAWLNQHIFKVEPYPFIDKAFLFYAFQAMISEFYKNSHGSGMVHITKKQFEEITILLPPLTEQIRIVECLEQTFRIFDSINCNL